MESDASCIRLSSLCVLCTDSSRVASGQGKETLHEGKLTSVSLGHDQSILCEVSYTESRRDVAEEQLWDYRMYPRRVSQLHSESRYGVQIVAPFYSIRGTATRRYAGLDAAQETLQAAFYFAHRNQLEGGARHAATAPSDRHILHATLLLEQVHNQRCGLVYTHTSRCCHSYRFSHSSKFGVVEREAQADSQFRIDPKDQP